MLLISYLLELSLMSLGVKMCYYLEILKIKSTCLYSILGNITFASYEKH